MAAKQLRYLTVQDVLWINLQVSGRVNGFDYATLEEATFYQYAYGDSKELLSQAQRFLHGFLAKSPISAANEATAFVAFATFLRLNGVHLSVDDAEGAEWMLRREADLAGTVRRDEHYHPERMKDAVTAVLRRYPRTLEKLGGDALEVIADGAIH
jgi:death-on-curing protein